MSTETYRSLIACLNGAYAIAFVDRGAWERLVVHAVRNCDGQTMTLPISTQQARALALHPMCCV